MLPAVTQFGWAAAVAVVGIVSNLLSAPTFHETACARFEPYLDEYLVGQGPATRVLTDAICDFLDGGASAGGMDNHNSPLVVSLHGPPGVGKTYFHKLAARALYNAEERCPGRGCPAYKVLFGMDYSSEDVAEQHKLLQNSLIEHVALYPQSLIVIEEYDKLDCHMRGFFRQMLQGNLVAGEGNRTTSLEKSIVILESNLGYSVLHGLLEGTGGNRGSVEGMRNAVRRQRDEVPMEDAQRALKDMIFSVWRAQGCEDFSDSQKFMRSVDHFLPFYPLEEEDIVALFEKKLLGYEEASGGRLGCDGACRRVVVPFLVDKVEFDGRYPIEGGKEVNTISTGYLSRPFRHWLEEQGQGAPPAPRGTFSWRLVDGNIAIQLIG
jgi:ATP-dependent Clp protease ATP-binding subunit ClpA